mmetsp:Transcript_3861/g.6831  ORF Transcript_3861/g.6831 Transcript_3861/m.6831 type:complete len:104 (-) Transcript_3861:87-398(-)
MLATTETNVNNQLIFDSIGKDFTFAPNEMTKEANICQNWLREKQEERQRKTHPTQSYICDTMSACRDYVAPSLEASPQNEKLEILWQNMTSNSLTRHVVTALM